MLTRKEQKNNRKEVKKMGLKNLLSLSLVAILFLLPATLFATEDYGITTQIININYEYDANGRLLNQTQTITTNGVDNMGGDYSNVTTINYTVTDGQALMQSMTSTTISDSANGVHTETVSTTTYTYDSAGHLTGASGTTTITGSSAKYTDDQGDYHAATQSNGSYNITYDIISGQAVGVGQTGTIMTYTYNESTGLYDLSSTQTTTVTSQYQLIAGELKLTSSRSITNTVSETKDAQGQRLWSQTDILTTYTYDANGALTATLGSGTGCGYELTENGYQTYTSTISVTYEIVHGVARQTNYNEPKTYTPVGAPANVDPAVRGQIQGAYYVASDANDRGTRNYYVYVIVSADAYDGKKGDGKYDQRQGEYYLVRINCGTNEDNAKSLVNEYSGKQGQTMTFFGDIRANQPNVIINARTGNGGFDIPN